MNKKTLSRIAAFSLACAAVVPTFGVVASADLLPTGKTNTEKTKELVAGTAYKLTWEVRAIKHEYFLDSDYKVQQNQTVVNDATSIKLKANNNTYDYKDTQYYQYSINATSIPTLLESAYAEQNKAWTSYKKEWDFYAFCEKYKNTETAGSSTNKDGKTVYYRNNGTTDTPDWGFYTLENGNYVNYSAPTSEPPATTTSNTTESNIEYVWVVKPTRSEISAATLITELGTDIITIDDDTNKITAATTLDAADYQISTTGSTSTGTTTGSTTTSATYSMPASSYRYSSSQICYSSLTKMYYPNLAALQSVEGSHSSWSYTYPSTDYSATNCYFDPTHGTYRSYLYDSNCYKVNTSSSSNSIYKVNGYYYCTYSDAYSAANGNTSNIDFVRTYSTSYDYFSNVTGSFYSTYYAALAASNGDSSKVDVLNNASTYDYYDPYYYYYLGYGNNYTTVKDTTSATMGKKSGWTAIAKSLKSTSAGSTVTVTMNDEETIPSTVLSAIKGRNVTVKFTLDNGVVYTVNGKDVTTAKDVDINTTYNTKNVPSKLAKAAVKKNDGVSSAQISIDSSSLGFTSDVTIKLPSKRAGYSAKLYRYNSSRNSLVLVDTATIKTNGKCTFENVTKGGDYVVVVY